MMFSRRFPSPGKEKLEMVIIRVRIAIAPKPAKTPMIIATIIIKVCSVILAFSTNDTDHREVVLYVDFKRLPIAALLTELLSFLLVSNRFVLWVLSLWIQL